MQLSAHLPGDPGSPRLAREILRERLMTDLAPTELAEIELLVSELVTNSVVHGDGEIQLRIDVSKEAIRGEVVDAGPGFEAEVRERGAAELSGRGLWMVAKLARRWGVHQGSSHVWFELGRSGDTEHPAPPELGADSRLEQFE